MSTATIVISRGRATTLMERSLTLAWTSQLEDSFLMVHTSELETYQPVAEHWGLTDILTHDIVDNVSIVRDKAIATARALGYEKLWLLDDDLLFSYRDWTTTKLPRLEFTRIGEVRTDLETVCGNDYPMVALGCRMFAHARTESYDINRRMLWTPMLHLPTFEARGWGYEWEGDFMEDYRLQCQVVREGFKTVTLNSFVADDALGAWCKGGCNLYRNIEGRNNAAKLLAATYPEYIKLVQKQSPSCEDYLDIRMKLR